MRLLAGLLFALLLLAPQSVAVQSAAVQEVDGKTFDQLAEDARSDDARARRVAVGRLAEFGTEEAFELVVEALADEEPEVADQAQLDLATLPVELAGLLGGKAAAKAKASLVRERVAELLGRAEFEVDAGLLEDLLGDREPAVRRMACWSAERLGAAGWPAERGSKDFGKLLAALEKAARRDRETGVRGAALLGWFALEEPAARATWLDGGAATLAVELAREFGADRSPPELRIAAILLLSSGERTSKGRALSGLTVAAIGAQLDAEEPAVRRAAIEGLARLGTKAAMEALALRLGEEPRSVLSDLLLERLRAVTGRRHGSDPRPWLQWLGDQPDDWSGATEEEVLRADPTDAGDTVVRLAGLPITSRQVAFLIDMSGSMWNEDDAGRTLKELVDVELAKCLEALPKGAEFLLVPYATEPGPYEDGSIEVKGKNVAKALEWFEKNRLRGRGNVWDAFAIAAELAEFDTVVIFTDGAPTGGPHWNMGLMVELLLEATRFRPVTFHSILTDPNSGRLKGYWADLARRSGGRSIVVDLGAGE